MKSLETTGGRVKWYAVYTSARAEKKVAERLNSIGVETYCPTREVIRQWSDRKVKVQEVLFKSYVFVRLKENELFRVFEVPGVVRFLYWLGKPAIIRDEEIYVIQTWLEGDEMEEVEVSGLEPGAELHLKKGIWKDQRAIVQEVGKNGVKLVLPQLGFVLKAKLSQLFYDTPH
ncbi:UpxY family transcription antiterminator [uncultured Salegentibacter sp.]|uniref:UpxY family transcription antiterminator n=1 Tax=uncultured Salegentibacter sp. TaxID=259320 RepID=UPI0030DAF93A